MGNGHLVLVSHYFPAHRGGVEIVADRLARELAAAGWHINWFASATDSPPANASNLDFHPVPAWNGIEHRWGLPFPLWSLRTIPQLWRAIGQAEVIHLHDYLYFGNLLAFVIAKLRFKPVLVTQHIGTIPYDSAVLRNTLGLLNRSLGRLVLSIADQVVFVSPAVMAYFQQFCRFRMPPQHIANGVDNNIFHPLTTAQRISSRVALEYTAEDPLLLFVGRFVEKKGLPLLRELAQSRPDIHWLFAGQGPLDPEAWGLPNVHVFRNRSDAALAELYSIADLLVLPSKGEGFPLVVQEAMACGTPALVTAETAAGAPDLADLMEKEEIGLPDAPRFWLEKIDALLLNMDKLKVMRATIAEAANRHWSWTRTTAAYQQILTQLLERQS